MIVGSSALNQGERGEATVAAVKAASISDLEEVKGISHAKAEMLYNALHNGV